MFDEARDPVSILEERELLQQIVSLGVGYPHCKSWGSNSAISDMSTLSLLISRMGSYQKYYDLENIIHEAGNRIRSGAEGYYLIDLYNGHILSKEKYRIEDIIIQFTILNRNDRFNIRRRRGTRLQNMVFLISPKGVFFVGVERAYFPFKEFHMISFVSSSGKSKSGFVVDYDAVQNNRPLVLFPCEENNDIIQDQLDKDERYFKEERKAFLKHIGVDWEE